MTQQKRERAKRREKTEKEEVMFSPAALSSLWGGNSSIEANGKVTAVPRTDHTRRVAEAHPHEIFKMLDEAYQCGKSSLASRRVDEFDCFPTDEDPEELSSDEKFVYYPEEF